MNFDVVARAGLTQGEFAQLCGVSRVTACLWINGHCDPHFLHDGNIRGVLSTLERAVANKHLPVKMAPSDSRRAMAIHDAYWAAAHDMVEKQAT